MVSAATASSKIFDAKASRFGNDQAPLKHASDRTIESQCILRQGSQNQAGFEMHQAPLPSRLGNASYQ